MKYLLPESLLQKAFRSPNGELAWKKEDLKEVVDKYIALGIPVEAFEVWLVNESGQWTGMLPTSDETGHAVCVFDVEQKKSNESQEEFVQRSGQEILSNAAKLDPEKYVKSKYRRMIHYNLYIEGHLY